MRQPKFALYQTRIQTSLLHFLTHSDTPSRLLSSHSAPPLSSLPARVLPPSRLAARGSRLTPHASRTPLPGSQAPPSPTPSPPKPRQPPTGPHAAAKTPIQVAAEIQVLFFIILEICFYTAESVESTFLKIIYKKKIPKQRSELPFLKFQGPF